jgi:peptide/nickel transport system substrate-binding protein
MAKRIGDIQSLDPAEAYETSGEEVIGNLYDRLLDYDPAHIADIRGALAQSWSVDEEGRRYTFKMRPGVHFTSGDPVTAEDAAFSLRRAVFLNKAPAMILRQFGFTASNVSSRIRAEDNSTLVLETATPVAPSFLFYCLTATVGSVVDRREVLAHERLGDLGHDWLATHSAGSGPYRLHIWRPGERYALDANEKYWGGAPKNRRVLVLNIKEAATQRLLLEHGDADYARDLDKDQLAALAHNPQIAFDRGLQTTLTYIGLNQRNTYLRRPQVVEALKYLVDYDGIAHHLLGGTRVVHQSFLPDGLLGAVDDRPFAYDPARAKTLLAAAGLPDGFSVKLDVLNGPPWIDIAQALQAGFARAGVRLVLVPGDGKEILTKYRARRHELFLGEWATDYPDPQSNAQAFTMDADDSDAAPVKTLAWRNGWQDPAAERLAEKATHENNIARRAALYGQLQHELQRNGPYIFLFQQVGVAAHRRGVKGLVIGASPDHTRYAGITKE